MNKAYLNRIVRKLRCSGKKRREIRQQLLSEMEAELENGIDEKELIRRMGTPREIAEEFNRNFSEKERKRYKRQKLLRILGVIAVCLLILVGLIYWLVPKQIWLADSRVFDEEEVIEQAEDIVTLFDEKDYEALREASDETMKKFLVEEDLENSKKLISENWGTQTSVGKIYADEVTQMGKKSAVLQMHVDYEHVSVLYTISFNDRLELQGFFMK